MLRLTTLGAMDLRDRLGKPVREVLSQPKRLALLIYLAIEGRRGPVPRDRLLAMFWPESDTERARNTLSQALHHLRQALGPGVLESQGVHALGVDAQKLWCDAVVFADALERGDPELALDVYRGEFCPSLFVSGAPDVEEWLDGQRRGLHRQALAAARTLAERLAAEGSADAAARAARRALALRPDTEADVRALLALLERVGDGAGALLAYQEHARRLQVELETEPDAETRALADAIRRRREPAAAPRAATPDEPLPSYAAAATPRVAPMSPGRRRTRHVAAIATVTAAVAVALALLVARRPSTPPDARLLMVAPFALSAPDSSLAFVRQGLADLVSRSLSGAGPLRAVDARTVRSALGSNDPSEAAAVGAAQRLGAGWLILGDVVGPRDRLTVALQLRSTDGSRQEALTVTGPLDSLGVLADDLARQVLVTIAAEPVLRRRSLARVPLPALRAYLEGRSAYRAGAYAEAVRHFREALAVDPTFAAAALELAAAADFITDGSAAQALTAAWQLRDALDADDRAILLARLGPRFPEPAPWERLEAAQRAVRIAPERPDAWYELGDLLLHWGAVFGEDSGFVRATAALSRASALDSAFAAPLGHLVQIAAARSDLSAMRRLFAAYLRRDSSSTTATYLRWRVAVALGDSTAAQRIEAGLDTLPFDVLRLIAEYGQLDGVRGDVAFRAAEIGLRRATGGDRYLAERGLAAAAVNAGRMRTAHGVWEAWRRSGLGDGPWYYGAVAASAHFSDGDTAAASYDSTMAALGRMGTDRSRQYQLEVAVARQLAGLPVPQGQRVAEAALQRFARSHPLYRYVAAARSSGPEADLVLQSADTARHSVQSGLQAGAFARSETEARLIRGDAAGAAAAATRTGYQSEPWYLAPLLRLEGQAREQLGDTAGAVRAYRRYLVLRFDPDPELRPYNDSVRAALTRLERR